MNSIERTMRVSAVTAVADGVIALTLVDPDGGLLPEWQPGAHLDVVLPGPLVRQYSLCGATSDRTRYRIAVLFERDGRGGFRYLHERVHAGDELRIRGPRNNFRLEEAEFYQFVAGGIGITPILPMIAEVQRAGLSWALLYGGRSLDSMAFLDELEAYPGQVTVVPQDRLGLPDLDALLGDRKPGTKVYCCGPGGGGLIDAVRARCDEEVLRYELFRAPETDDVDSAGDHPFEVVLASTGKTVLVQPGESVLAKVLDSGADVLHDCRDGICGSCETAILEGEADHRDHVLTAAEQRENSCMMICVSRCRGERLVLDL